ncbi:MAG: hypothetical protein J6V98_07610 [Bacteroidales bacterium]|nr:hypothetical protein [Bacteroidales bacterium]
MKRSTNIFLSAIMLMMILLGTSGVSVEKCSCTGKISLALPTDGDCCPDEGGCMTVKYMQLSDYMPTTIDGGKTIDTFPVLCLPIPSFNLCGHSLLRPTIHRVEAPPGNWAQTVTVLRV